MRLLRASGVHAQCAAAAAAVATTGRGYVATIGGFDGLHVGHRQLIARACERARALDCDAMLLSFEPLPLEFLRSDDPPARLTNFRERWRVLQHTGIDVLCLLRFDAALRALSAAQFLTLLHELGVRQIVVGHDFRFGQRGEGDAEWCRARAAEFGFDVDVVAPVMLGDERVGSRRVREALAKGDLALAARWLGRRYSMRGRVQRGAQLGRQLGYPTANIAPHRRRLPLSGIFAVRVHADCLPTPGWPGVASLGTRPVVNGVEPLLEAHLFDYGGDLYGQELEVEFVARLRDEQQFDSLELLTEQIHRDAAAARRILAAGMPGDLDFNGPEQRLT
jgi:riboflavin kinase/FMN adenylyltransferase